MQRVTVGFIGLTFCVLLTACSSAAPQPIINFIGIGTGTLTSDVSKINFRQSFKVNEQQLVAVVSFGTIASGSTVQATWFTPDERVPPLGRTTIVTQSGARIARFSFASKDFWKPAPYEVRIDAYSGKADQMRTASGTLSFFIGMKEADVQNYVKEYMAWQKETADQRASSAKVQEEESTLSQQAARVMNTRRAFIVSRQHIRTKGGTDYIIEGSDNVTEDASVQQNVPGVLFAASLHQFAILNGSGNVLVAIQKGRQNNHTIWNGSQTTFKDLPADALLQVVLLSSLKIELSWTVSKTCNLELTLNKAGVYDAGIQTCH